MNQYMKEISALRKKISLNDLEAGRQLMLIGKELTSLKEKEIAKTQLEETWNSIKELEQAIPERKKSVQQIKKAEEKTAKLESQIAATKHTITEKKKEIAPVYERIGKSAFEVFKNKRESLSDYQALFGDLIKLDQKCREYHRVKVQDDEEKGILIQLFDAAKSFYINQKYNFLTMRYPVLYRETGKRIVDSDYIGKTDNPALNEADSQLKEKNNELEKLEEEVKRLSADKHLIFEELSEMGIKGKLASRVQEIEKEIKRMNQTIEELQQTMGNLFVTHNLNERFSNPSIETCLQNIYRLRGENLKHEAEIQKMEILIDIEKYDQQMIKLEKQRGQMEEQLEKQKSEIEALEQIQTRIEKQKKALKKKLDSKENGRGKKDPPPPSHPDDGE
ncbi:MAG: hypothetical protein JW881_03510 [Spirochaetales bacterium]|nr:hypothetical protein [Spirochaetales bacterium]